MPLGEVVHLWERGVIGAESCGCGVAFPECPFWAKVGEQAFGQWSEALAYRMLLLRRRVDRTRHIPPRRSVDLMEYVERYRRIYQAAAEVADCAVVIDSSKHASLAFCLVAAGVDVHVVHVVRDPRGVAYSWLRRVERPEDGAPMTRWGPVRTSLHWMAQNLALELLAARGARVTRVRYEDLLDAPRRTLARLLLRLGLASPLRFLGNRRAMLGVGHTVSGNPMRFTAGAVELVRDDTWRSGLSRSRRWLVLALTWPLMIRYGYCPRGAAP
ncbi:hypothetical protein HNP84_003858 [Thermocatellispora tengchongensis]|uniref:Sulfotransferase n=1 Tax=Thermocatellispora tengchongensis TaxID=1073253 RepID=A0A840P440_9ACTN|nr:hypothetical protein [Thermocatellispora tengchongensis]